MEHLICLFGKWYDLEKLKYETYCTNNTLEDDKLWQEKKKYWEQRRYEIAKDILSTMFYRPENHSLTVEADVDFAVEVADILIEKLKKGE